MVPVGFESGESQLNLERFYLSTERKSHSAPQHRNKSANDEDGSEIKEKGERKQLTLWEILSKSIFGQAPFLTHLIDQQKNEGSFLISLCLSIIESILRSIGNVVFVSNPFSGLIIFITMFFSAPSAAVLGMVSLISGIFTTLWVVRLPMEIIRGGSVTFNSFLLGSIVAADVKDFEEFAKLIPICIFIGIFTIFCYLGMEGLFQFANIPVLNAPCNILGLIFVYSGLSSILKHSHGLHGDSFQVSSNASLQETFGNFDVKEARMVDQNGSTEGTIQDYEALINEVHESIDCYKILGGIILAQGQIFQTNSIATSAIVYLSVLIYSPILFFQQLMGASVGSLIGVALSRHPFNDLYNGGFSYNSLLTSGAIGGFFIGFNLQAWTLSLIGSILSALIYSALINNGAPAFGFPFMLATWLLLPVTSSVSNLECEDKQNHCYKLYKVTDFTTPEINRRCCIKTTTSETSDDKYRRPKSTVLPL